MIHVEQSADLELNTPMELCCNCGCRPAPPEALELVETPLKRTRFFLLGGTELTLHETFPYCRACRRSARRVRLGWMGKALGAVMMCSVIFLVLVLAAPELALPGVVKENLFLTSVLLAVLLTAAYFAYRARDAGERSYYQPVSLADVTLGDGFLAHARLRLWNAKYAQLLARANVDRIRAGMLSLIDRDAKEYAAPAARAALEPAVSRSRTWFLILLTLSIAPWAYFWINHIAPRFGMAHSSFKLHLIFILGVPIGIGWLVIWLSEIMGSDSMKE